MMETPDYLGLNIYQGFMVNEQGEEVVIPEQETDRPCSKSCS